MSNKTMDLILNISFAIFLLFTGVILGGTMLGVVWYLQPAPTPIYQPQEVIEVPVYETVYETVEVTKIVEIIVTATPDPIQLPAPTQIVTEVVEEPSVQCTDQARIEMQPRSDIQGSAIQYGNGRRLTWIIENTGDCIWDGYLWQSAADPLVLEVPYTLPGEKATIIYDFVAKEPFQLRMFLVNPNTLGLLGLSNVNTNDGGAIYELHVWSKLGGGQGTYNQQVCGPSG